MKFLLKFILVIAVIWSGYWFIGAQASKAGFEAWFEQQRERGWTAKYTDFEVQGFPNRFDAGFSGISLVDPYSGMAWYAPFFQILALSYKPNHIIAVWPDNQTFSTPYDIFQISSDDMRASLRLEASTKLGLKSAVLTTENLVVAPTIQLVEPTSADSINFAIEHVEDTPSSYRLGLTANGLAPPASVVAQIDPQKTLPEQVTVLNADLTARFDHPWDRMALEISLPQPRDIDVTNLEALWGRLHLKMNGTLTVDVSGVVTGKIDIKARNWRDIIALFVSTGAMPQTIATPLEEALAVIAKASDDPEVLNIPLRFDEGYSYLGPVSLGPAPIIILR